MIKTLAKSIREFKKPTILSPVFVIFEVILDVIIPFLMSRLINAMNGDSMNPILIYGASLILMAFLSLLFGMLSGKECAKASTGFAKNLRHDVFKKVQGFSFANIDKFSTPGLVTRLTVDITNIQQSFMMLIRIAVRAPLMLIFSFAMATVVSPKMALIFVVVIPILATGLFLVIWKAIPIFNKLFKRYDAMNESVQENIKGMRVVKAYVREDFESEKFVKTSDDLRQGFTKAEKLMALMSPIMQFCMYTASSLIIFFGARLIVKTFGGYDALNNPVWGELSVGELSSLITYSVQVLMNLMMLSMTLVMITMANASAKRISEVLNEESTIKNPENPVMEVKDGSIEFDNVSFKYSADAPRRVLKEMTLSIKSGETLGIIGGTGSSKTSLVQLIPRLYDVYGGSVKVGGVDVREYDLDVLRSQVAMVLQKNVLFSGTIKENLRWGNKDATDKELIKACKIAQAHDFVVNFPAGYDTFIEQGGTNVSGGQRQRLCIARALVANPKILILDDSTSAVDTKTDALIRKAFREDLPNVTKIIIAQRISSVEDADKILVLDGGNISGIGTHKELLENNAIYKEVYNSQNKAGK